VEEITILKCNPQGKEVWRYNGIVLRRTASCIVVEAKFNHDDLLLQDILLGRGDRFVEIYFSDRWYNIFEIHDRDDDHLKGWYCNITYPMEIKDGIASYNDLALDLLVYPDGRQLVLDEEEFAVLEIEPAVREQALEALNTLQHLLTIPPDLMKL
jgi:predicted RNA-binding protein associated with RNAse of E/G family